MGGGGRGSGSSSFRPQIQILADGKNVFCNIFLILSSAGVIWEGMGSREENRIYICIYLDIYTHVYKRKI